MSSGFSCAPTLAGLDGVVVDQVGGRRHGFGAERLERIEDHLSRRHADLHPGEIVRLDHGARHRCDLAHAVVETGDREQVHALRRHLLAHIGAQRGVDRLVRLRRRFECERHLLRFGDRHHRADDAAHQGEELDFARDQQLEGRGIAGDQLVVLGEYRGLDAAIGLGADRIPHGNEIAVQRHVNRLVVVLGELVVGGLRTLDDDGGAGCSGEHRAPRQFRFHDHVLRSFGCGDQAPGRRLQFG